MSASVFWVYVVCSYSYNIILGAYVCKYVLIRLVSYAGKCGNTLHMHNIKLCSSFLMKMIMKLYEQSIADLEKLGSF